MDDKKTVILTLSAALDNGHTYKVDIKDVIDTNYNKVKEYKTDYVAFVDKAAPKLVDAKITSANKVVLTFDEPVQAAMTVKVDGVEVATNVAKVTNDAGDYSYVTTAIADKDLTKAGTHKVVIYGATDNVSTAGNRNTSTVLSKDVVVGTDVTAPSVIGITAKGQDTFKVKFSEPITPALGENNLEVKKGNLLIPTGKLHVNIDTDDTTDCTYIVAVDNVDADNKLYLDGESSVTLSVKVKGYTDKASLVGTEYNSNVTLTKDVTGPTVVSSKLNRADAGQYLLVKFDEAIAVADHTKITVTNDGIIKTVIGATVDAGDATRKTLKIDLGNTNVKYGTYNIKMAAGAIKDAYDNKNVAIETSVDNTANSAITPLPLAYNAGLAVGQLAVANNAITINYGINMDDSAINIANYKLDGASFPAGTTIGFVGDKTKVKITLPDNYFRVDTNGILTVTSKVTKADGTPVVKTANMDENEVTLTNKFTDNVQPELIGAKFVVGTETATSTNTLELEFSENLAAVTNNANFINDFKVKVNGAKVTVKSILDETANDKKVKLVLDKPVVTTQDVTVEVVKEETTDNPTMNVTDNTSAATKNKLKATEKALAITEKAVDTAYAKELAADKAALTVTATGGDADLEHVKNNVTLSVANNAAAANGSTITWSCTTTDTATITNAGNVTRSNVDNKNDVVTLTATITKGEIVETRDFVITILENKVPTLKAENPVTISDDKKVVTIECSEAILNNKADIPALKGDITIATDGSAYNALNGADTVEITEDGKLKITFNTALSTATNKIKIAASALKDAAGNVNAEITTDAINAAP